MDADAFRDIIVLVISYTQTKQKTAFDGYFYLIYNELTVSFISNVDLNADIEPYEIFKHTVETYQYSSLITFSIPHQYYN